MRTWIGIVHLERSHSSPKYLLYGLGTTKCMCNYAISTGKYLETLKGLKHWRTSLFLFSFLAQGALDSIEPVLSSPFLDSSLYGVKG